MRELDDLMNITAAEDPGLVYVVTVLKERLSIPELMFGQTNEGCLSIPNAKGSIVFYQFLSGLSSEDLIKKSNKLHLQMYETDSAVQEVLGEGEIPRLSRPKDPLSNPLVEFGEDVVKINFDILGSI